MQLQRANNVADVRLMASRRLLRPIFDYIDGGADDEVSLRRNVSAFAGYEFIPDALNDVSSIRTETKIFGQPSRWPLMLSPTGLTRIFHGHAELAVARAAESNVDPHLRGTIASRRSRTPTAYRFGRRHPGPS